MMFSYSPLSDNLMQSIATEINLSETCFIYDKDGHFKNQSNFGLRWFTPTNEVGRYFMHTKV